MFTGASQFAFVGVIGGGGEPARGRATALLLGARNALYGLRLSSLLRVRGARRAVAAQLVIDESAAMALARGRAVGFWATGLAVFVCWNARHRCSARSAARRSPTRARSASTPPRPPRSSRCSPRGWTGRSARTSRRRRGGARWSARAARARRRAGAGRGARPAVAADARDVGRDPSPPAGATCSSSPASRSRGACSSAPRVAARRRALPVALLAALIAVSTFTDGRTLVLDERVAGLAAAGVAVALRAPFLVVVGGGVRGDGGCYGSPERQQRLGRDGVEAAAAAASAARAHRGHFVTKVASRSHTGVEMKLSCRPRPDPTPTQPQFDVAPPTAPGHARTRTRAGRVGSPSERESRSGAA